MATTISYEEFMAISAFLDGDRTSMPVDAIVRLQQMSADASRALAREASRVQNESMRLKAKMERMARRDEKAVATGEAFAELGLDSVDVANALVARLRELKTYQLNKDKVSLILFEIYASWLASKRERITIEHPQATPYGPRFWRAYGKMDLNAGDDATARLAAANPGLSVMVANAARKYYDYSVGDLERYLKKSEPYKASMPKPGEGKWNAELPDPMIYAWKKGERQ